jgi:hypothetical protein
MYLVLLKRKKLSNKRLRGRTSSEIEMPNNFMIRDVTFG